MKKAKAENVALKSDLHELLKAQGSVLSTMFEKYFRRRKPIIAILPSYTKLSSDVVTISNQKPGEGLCGVVSIGHIKTLD